MADPSETSHKLTELHIIYIHYIILYYIILYGVHWVKLIELHIKGGRSQWTIQSLFLYGIRGYFIVSVVLKQPTFGFFTFGVEFWKKLCSFLFGNRLRWIDSAHFKLYYSFTQRYFIWYLTGDCCCSFFKAVDGCLYLTCLPFTYGRKNPKYQKKPVKACLLTLYVGKSKKELTKGLMNSN